MINTISIDAFGKIESLNMKLNRFHQVDKSSGGDSLLTMLCALVQSFVPGYALDWQLAAKPGESGFGSGKLAVRGKLLEGGTFADLLYKDSRSCLCGLEFVLENPENPVDSSTRFADKKRAGADDFRELCRLFGEKFGNVKRFVLLLEVSFAQRNEENILSYQMVNVRCERVFGEDISGFFELVLYRNGSNYDLYWDEMPDIRGIRQSGRAKGCNVRMRNLAILDIVTDGVQDGARFEEVLPRIIALSRIAACQFETLRFLDTCGQMPWISGSCGQTSNFSDSGGQQMPVFGSCYYVGLHGEYAEEVIRTYTGGRIRIAWPDPATGEVRHGLFEEAYEAWRAELAHPSTGVVDISELERGNAVDASKLPDGNAVTASVLAVLVQGLILRTGETLVLSENCDLPEKFFLYMSRMGRQVLLLRQKSSTGKNGTLAP